MSDKWRRQTFNCTDKWLIAHEEAQIPGAFCGLVGENITLK